MHIYYFEGYGREIGALGVRHFFNCEVHANSYDEAVTELYSKYEHISIESYTEWKDKGRYKPLVEV